MVIVVIASVAVLTVAVLVVDWVRTNRVRKALAAGGEAPRGIGRRRTSETTDYQVIAQQSASTRNQTSGLGGI